MMAKAIEVSHNTCDTAKFPPKKSDTNGLHNSGTDSFPFLTKKRRIDQSDFNYACQLDQYLKVETMDNIFIGDADHGFSQSAVISKTSMRTHLLL